MKEAEIQRRKAKTLDDRDLETWLEGTGRPAMSEPNSACGYVA